MQKLFELIRLRNTHPAFGGRFFVEDSADDELVMRWRAGTEFAELAIRFADERHRLVFSHEGGRRALDLLAPSLTLPRAPRRRDRARVDAAALRRNRGGRHEVRLRRGA